MNIKVCRKCGIKAKTLEEKQEIFGFYKVGSTKYVQSRCKKCRNKFYN